MINIGNLKSLLLLWEYLATNRRYSKYVDKKDLFTFQKRTRAEGISFLTTKLPSLGKALDRFHATNEWIPPSDFVLDGDKRPIFLGGCLARCFEGDPDAVDCYRQLTLIFYKLEVDYDPEIERSFLEDFKKVDQELPTTFDITDKVLIRARSLVRRVLCNTDPLDSRPCHGSGATACRTSNAEKWHKLRYYPKLDAVFSYPDYFFYSYTHLADQLDKLQNAEESFPRARVVLVPKDSRGPRVISCEPAEMMYIQQGLMRSLYRTLETHPLTKGRINFTDQSVNQELARIASYDGNMATLDLAEASDRVSLALVQYLFSEPWVEALEASRSEETTLPSGEVLKLNKFAPMGSSCCFPVEAIVFWAIAVASIQIHVEECIQNDISDDTLSGVRLTRNWRYPRYQTDSELPDVFVYGDDIIVDARWARLVMDGLEAYGLKVNRTKSYVSGPFRESCGGDFYLGTEVTPVRVRKALASSACSQVTDATLCNTFIAKFGYEDARSIVSLIDSLYPLPLPRSLRSLPGCVNSTAASNDVFYQRRWNKDLQRYEHRIPSPYTKSLDIGDIAWCELLRKELGRDVPNGHSPYENPLRIVEAHMDPGHYAVTHSARMRWVWTWLD